MHPRAGQVAQLGEAAGVDDPARPHDAHPVAGPLDLAEDVARQQHGAAVGPQVGELALEDLLHERVEAGGRLVEDEQRHVAGEGRDEGDLLPVALGVGLALLGLVELEALDEAAAPLLVDAAAQPAEQVDDLAAAEATARARRRRARRRAGGAARSRRARGHGRARWRCRRPRAAGRAGCGSSSTCRRRWARGSRGPRPRGRVRSRPSSATVGAERLAQAGHGDDVGHALDATPVSEICECCKLRVCRRAESRSRLASTRPGAARRGPRPRPHADVVEHLGGALADAGMAAPAGAGLRRAHGRRGRSADRGRAGRGCST